MEYAIVKSGIVENVIEWDGVSEFTVDGELVLADNSAWIGAKYDGAFEAKPIPPDTRTYSEKRSTTDTMLNCQWVTSSMRS